MPYLLSRFRFCYLDTEYLRPDYTVPPLDKCDPDQVELYYSVCRLLFKKVERE